MDPYTAWDDLVPNRSRPPPDDDFSQYFSEYKNIDNLFNETLTTLQDLDVPSGFPPATAPPMAASPFRHAKKPSGTAIFGFAEHTRELSLGGHDMYKKQPQDNLRLILPAQLARAQNYAASISHDQLDFNFSQPLEECKPIHLDENDELPKKDDLIVTNSNPKSYKFPPDGPRQNLDEFLAAPIAPIRHPHPKQQHQYPEEIDELLGEKKRYVAIPVQEPYVDDKKYGVSPQMVMRSTGMSANMNSSMGANMAQNLGANMAQNMSPNIAQGMAPTASVGSNVNVSQMPPHAMPRDLNMNVFLPPPLLTSLHDSPEPRSPLPQVYSLPIRHRQVENTQNYEKRNFYNPQFFSDDADLYYADAQDYRSPSHEPALLHSLPVKYNDSYNDDTTDVNETILQLTPLKSQAPITPLKNKITLEWSPIISPNAKANSDVRRAIQELSPRRVIKKTSLLPPGELDRYWEGPDENKVFTCTYKNCGKKFTRRYNVRSHIQTHLSDRPFTCTYCPKSFVRQHDLNRHVKSHLVLKHCRCKCGKEFTRVEGYKKHLQNGICSRVTEDGGVMKPQLKNKSETVLDGLTSNRLNDELGL